MLRRERRKRQIMNLTIAKDIRTEQVISKSRFICSLKKVKTEEEVPDTEEEVNEDPDEGKSDQDIRDELTGQLSLF